MNQFCTFDMSVIEFIFRPQINNYKFRIILIILNKFLRFQRRQQMIACDGNSRQNENDPENEREHSMKS